MGKTLLQLRTQVRFFIDEKVQANFLDSDINYAINEAQQDVATEISQVVENFFINTTPTALTISASGGAFYTLPDDFWKMKRLEDVATGIKIKFVDENEDAAPYVNVPGLTNINQVALAATIVGNSLRFIPTPTATRSLQYWYVPVLDDLVSDTDETPIPRMFASLLAMQAAIDCMIEDEADATQLQMKLNKKWDQLKRTTRDRQQQNPKYVRRTASSGYGTV